MRRFMQAVIVANVAIVALTTAIDYAHDHAHTGTHSLLGRALIDLVAVSIGYVVLSVIAFFRFERDPAWLLAPVAFLVPLSVAGIYQAALGTGPIGAAVCRPLLIACYLAGYFVLSGAEADTDAVETPVEWSQPARRSRSTRQAHA